MSQSASINQRILKLVVAAPAVGIMPGELSTRLRVSPPTVTRHLRELRAEGKIVRLTRNGPVYAPEFAPMVGKEKAAPGKPRPRRRSRRDDGEVEFADVLQWLEKRKVIAGVGGLLLLFGILRPDKIAWHQGQYLQGLATMGVQGRERAEKIISFLGVEAVGRQADAFSPEELQARLDAENRRRADNYNRSWNLRLEDLERHRTRVRSVIEKGTSEEKAHYLVTMKVLVPIDFGQPALSLRRAWRQGVAFPDEARRDIGTRRDFMPPNDVVTVLDFDCILGVIAVKLDRRIREHRVEPLPLQAALPRPQPPMTDAQRDAQLKKAAKAEAKRQKEVARTIAANQPQVAEEEPDGQGPTVHFVR